ncbi:MAG TPA: SEC-C metal-binding domain-containing protein, partial [Dongiaceae bacterium]|nr:SEC-C metal-binding domain-containing protein [Dongiaceae bacterium]
RSRGGSFLRRFRTPGEPYSPIAAAAARRGRPDRPAANAYAEQWNMGGLHEECRRVLGLDLPVADWAKEEGIADEAMRERITSAADRKMAEKAANFGPEVMRMAEKSLLLQLLDQSWKDHLLSLDHLRHGIGLRAYGQRDPLNEYKREAFEMFEEMLRRLRESVTGVLSHIEVRVERPEQAIVQRAAPRMQETRRDPVLVGANGGDEIEERAAPRPAPVRRAAAALDAGDPATWGKVARNALCPCGSGKKFKHCHGKM